MHRLAIAFVMVAACGGTPKQGSTAGSGQAIYAKKAALSWGLKPNAGGADVFLELTDETGKQTSYPLGTFPGECKSITPVAAMKAPTGVACTSGATGIELDAVVDGEQIVVLKLATQQGVAPDPMAREELTRVAAPNGSAVVVAP